jgi:hypothetical protein
MARKLIVEVVRPLIIGVQKYEVGTILEVPELYQHGVENIHANPKQEGGARVRILSVGGVATPCEDLTDTPAVVISADGQACLVRNPDPVPHNENHKHHNPEHLKTTVVSSRPGCDGSAWRGI